MAMSAGWWGSNQGGSITASYATGAVSGTGTLRGGLVGDNDKGAITVSYWDTQTTGQSTSDGGVGQDDQRVAVAHGLHGHLRRLERGPGRRRCRRRPVGLRHHVRVSRSRLQQWELRPGDPNSDPHTDADTLRPTPTPTPTPTPPAPGSADYDADDDGLIDVASLARLNAIRWDLDGDGSPTDSSAYAALRFPARPLDMGCPSTGCTGYELTTDINLGVAPYNTGSGWEPIGTSKRGIHGHIRGQQQHRLRPVHQQTGDRLRRPIGQCEQCGQGTERGADRRECHGRRRRRRTIGRKQRNNNDQLRNGDGVRGHIRRRTGGRQQRNDDGQLCNGGCVRGHIGRRTCWHYRRNNNGQLRNGDGVRGRCRRRTSGR